MTDTVKIAVCDDEKNIRSYLVSLIKKQDTNCSIMEYASADEYRSSGKECDLLFLDIGMDGPDAGMDGMELARHIRDVDSGRQPVIVFVTGYEKYVYDAFDVGAFQYLVKPVDEQKFSAVFRRAVREILSRQIASGNGKRRRKLVVPCAGEKKAIPFRDIYYMESQNHTIVLYLKSGTLEYYGKLGDLEKELAGQFYRIHRGYLISLFHVESYNRNEVKMSNGDKVPLSRYKYDSFVQAYMEYISEEWE